MDLRKTTTNSTITKKIEDTSKSGDSNGVAKPPVEKDFTAVDDNRYGWFGWKPKWIQRINRPVWLLVCMCCYSFMQGFIINGLINVVISTLEKRFDLPSQKTGLIASTYDLATATLVVFVSYYGGRGHKARWIGFGCMIFAVGGIVFGLPHFTTGLYKNTSGSLVCVSDDSTEGCVGSNLSNYFYVFILSQVLHGIGVTPLYSIGITLMDDSVTVRQSSLYLGIFYGLSAIGPGLGYIVGGAFLNIYTELGSVDAIDLTPNDPGWVGAWWLGFIISGVIAFIVAMPLLGFPTELPGTAEIRAAKQNQAHQSKYNDQVDSPTFGDNLSEFPRAIKYLLHNPTFIFLVLVGCCEGFIVSGCATFGSKVVETQFGKTTADASLLFGLCAIPGAGAGTILGGYLVKRWQLKVRGMVKFCCVTTTVTMATIMCMLVRCSQEQVVGVNVGYDGNMTNRLENRKLIHNCNSACGCTRKQFKTVCGDNGMEYFDPCFAGCTAGSEDAKLFTDCFCLSLGPGDTSLTATAGKCTSNCNLLPVFMIGTIILMVFHFMAGVPGVQCILRCVPESQRSLAIGVQWIVVRFLGTIPGPIAYDAALDSSCMLWQQDCKGEQGSCFLYSGSGISWKFFLMGFGFILLTLIFFLLALWSYHGPPEADGEPIKETKEDSKSKIVFGTPDRNDRNMNRMISSGSEAAIVANESLPEPDDVFKQLDNTKTPGKVYVISYV